eukprot:284151_1
MGVSVEFFPKLSSGKSFADLLKTKDDYPIKYWQLLDENEYDLLFEQWPQLGMEHYYEHGNVIHGGYNGISGQIGLFTPEYVYDESQHAIVPQQLKNNITLRKQFIDAYTINSKSGRDWVKYWNDTLWNDTDLLTKYIELGYSLPSYDKPIIWGSSFEYTMSKYTNNFTYKAKISGDNDRGIDWIFCPLGSEQLLSELVTDLYDAKQLFIANIYYPHKDFATVSELTSEQMTFQPIAMKFNQGNTRESACYARDYTCKEPVFSLFKMGNAKLTQTFPEMISFLYAFSVHGDDLNKIIISHQHENSWFNAACKWLHKNENNFEKYFGDINIIRYEYKPFSLIHETKAWFVVWSVCLVLIICLNTISIVSKVYNNIIIHSPKITIGFSIGMILLCFGTLFSMIQPIDLYWIPNSDYDIICHLKMYCYGIGSVLCIMSLLLKAYGVSNAVKNKIIDIKLGCWLFVALIAEWCFVFFLFLDKKGVSVKLDEYYRQEYHCNTDASTLFLWFNCGYILFLIIVLTIYAFKNGKLGIELFVDTKYAAFGSIICFLLCIATVTSTILTNDISILTNIHCGAMVLGILIVWCLFDGGILIKIFK